MNTVPVYECISQDTGAAGGVFAWNATGLVAYGVPQENCYGQPNNSVRFTQAGSGCEGFTINNNDTSALSASLYDTESGTPPFYYTITVEIRIPSGCANSSTVFAHELGHAHGMHDHYPHTLNGTPLNCGNSVVPATIMDCPGYTMPTAHDSDDILAHYRAIPYQATNRSVTAWSFNHVMFNFVTRAHNLKQYRMEKAIYGGSFGFIGYNPTYDFTAPNTTYCYRHRPEGWYGNNNGFVGFGFGCPSITTPHAVGTVTGIFSGSLATICLPAVTQNVTSYKVSVWRWSTGEKATYDASLSLPACYGGPGWQSNLAADIYHFGGAGCNFFGCSTFRDMASPSQIWTHMPGGPSGGGTPMGPYHTH